jgi:ankyrin repeat protein
MSSLEDFAEAIERGNSPIVESFISRDFVDVNVRLPRQNRPPALVHAARFGRKDVVDILLRANARVDETDERGWTACHVAALYNHRDVLELLLAHQPNVDVTDVGGTTAFFFAVRLSDEDASSCALMLLEAGASLEGRSCRLVSVRYDEHGYHPGAYRSRRQCARVPYFR